MTDQPQLPAGELPNYLGATDDWTDTFVNPCLTCGKTVHVEAGVEQAHEHQTFSEHDSPAAYAWWQGYDARLSVEVNDEGAFCSPHGADDAPDESKGAVPNAPASADLIHEDITAILRALGLGDHARPYSTHEVVHRDILPALAATEETQP